MPKFEPYPGESPEVARRRIAQNRAQDGNMPQPAGQTIADQMTVGTNLTWTDPNEGIPPRNTNPKKVRKPGTNITRNIGDIPDVGY